MKRNILILLLMFLSLSLFADKNENFFNRGIVYILIKDASLAQENMNQYFNNVPNPALRSAYQKLIRNEKKEATDRFKDYLNINHRSKPALIGIALSTADMEVSNTMEVLERAIRLKGWYSSAYLCLGMEYMKKKNYPLAERNLKQALSSANTPEYKIILAKLYLEINAPARAVSLLKGEADNNPDNFYNSYLLASAYFKLNQLRDTGKYIEAALEVNPQSNEAKLLMAKYLIGINELKRARAALNGIKFATYNKDYVKTYAHVLLELKDINVKDYLFEFFAKDKWDKDINRLMGRYYLWHRGKGNVQNWIHRAILSGAEVDLLKKQFPGNFQFPEYQFMPFFQVKKIKWLAKNIILLAAVKNSGERERIYIIDTEKMRVTKALNFNGKFQEIFLPKNYDGSGSINIVLSTVQKENESINLYAVKISGSNVILRPIFNRPQKMASVLAGFNRPGNLAYITDAAISKIAFDSPFSRVSTELSTMGRKTPIYPIYPFTIYQYNFNNSSLVRVADPEQIRTTPIEEVRKFFLISDAYQYNDRIKALINKGESLDLTSDEVVGTYIGKDSSSFIIYLADLENAFQALIYNSRTNRIEKIDETMFLGKGQYAEIQVLDFRPGDNEIVVMTKDKEKRLINFNYNSFLYNRLEKNLHDFCRDEKLGLVYILTERSKQRHFTETNLEVISFHPFYRGKIRDRKDLDKIISCDQFDQVYFSTYTGELLKLDAENKFHYVGPSFAGAVYASSPLDNQKAAFINGRLILFR